MAIRPRSRRSGQPCAIRLPADSWLGENPPQFDGRLRFALVAALLRRTASFSQVAEEALAIARVASSFTVDRDWGPLLVRAFPHGYPAPGELSPGQRQFLTAIADNDACWGPIANPQTWFRKAGLPSGRAEIRAPRRLARQARALTRTRQPASEEDTPPLPPGMRHAA